MKGQLQLDRTKVVLRHLLPTISEAVLLDRINSLFAGRYTWLSFRPGKNSQKHSFSRAYLNFKRPEDVIDFAELLESRVFVNEKDSEYLEFLEFLAKPTENLPSAEIQVERREAERAVLGTVKDTPVVTPLMDFVRQKRAAKGGSQSSLSNGELSRKGVGSSAGSHVSALSKRGTDRRRNSTKMHVLRDAIKNTVRDKSKHIGVTKRDTFSSTDGAEVLNGSGRKKVLLLTGKEREISHVSTNISLHQNTSTKIILGCSSMDQNQQCESSGGRIIRSMLLNKDSCQNHYSAVHSDIQIQASNVEKEKWCSRPQHGHLVLKDTNGAPDDKVVGRDMRGFCSEKKKKRTRNKDRPDRRVWAPRHRPNGSFAKDESKSSIASEPAAWL